MIKGIFYAGMPERKMSERKSYRRKVQEVIDGNTFGVQRRVEGSRYIRVAGLHSPERDEDGFDKAKQRLERIEGEIVTIKPIRRTAGRKLIARVILEGKDVADPTDLADAYKGIFNLVKTLAKERSKYSDLSKGYRAALEDFVERIPMPKDASPEDMAFVAQEILIGLLSWAYHEQTETKTPLHRYARFIAKEARKIGIDWSKSMLDPIKEAYLAGLR